MNLRLVIHGLKRLLFLTIVQIKGGRLYGCPPSLSFVLLQGVHDVALNTTIN